MLKNISYNSWNREPWNGHIRSEWLIARVETWFLWWGRSVVHTTWSIKCKKNMNIKYMHKKFFQVKCGNIIKYRSNARNKNIYKCRMQRNMNINIDQMNIDRILEKTTYQYHWKMQEPWPNHIERVDFLRSESGMWEMRLWEFMGGWDWCMWSAVCFIGGMDITVGF